MRLKPIVTQCLLAGVLSLPVTVGAVGLGKLTVQSALGQPLSAEVDLASVSRDEVASLTARVADPATYRQNNIDYPASAARVRVQLATRPSGMPYLRITSAQALSDPFLDLLIELNWASGRLVRNYTFLLDPPAVATAQAVEPVLAQGAASRSVAAPAGAASRAASTGAQGAAATAGTGSAAPSTPAARPTAGSSVEVKHGDTLMRIASRTRPPSATLEQTLLALFRANPGAFEGGNMNRLRAGEVLTIPAPEQIAATPAPEAQREVRMQAADWAAYRDRVAASAPTRDAGQATASATGRITTAVEDKGASRAPGGDRLTLSRAESAKGGAAVGASGRAEDLVAKEKAIAEMNTRVAELEKTVTDLRRALELKSQALTDLQRQAEAMKGPAVDAGKAGAAAAGAAAAPSAAAAAPGASPAQSPAVPGKAAEGGAVDTKASEAKTAEATAQAETKPEAAKEPVKAATPAGDKASPKPAAPPQPGFLETVFSDTPGWAIGAGALAILGGAWALLAARRRREAEKVEQTIGATDLASSTVFGQTAGGVVSTGEPSISSEFSREGLGSIDTDEVDPIAEAEVYLAYGRDSQAEEILKDALKKDPERQEVYGKLLEIHAQHNKPSAFEAVASELHGISGGTGEAWEKAAALGRQIDPTNRLYSGDSLATVALGAGGLGAAATAAAAAGGLDLVTPGSSAVPGIAQKAGQGGDSRSWAPTERADFNLDQFMSSTSPGEAAKPSDSAKAPPVPDLDATRVAGPDFGIPAPKFRPESSEEIQGARQPFDFDLKLDDILAEPGTASVKSRDSDLATLDFLPTPAKAAAAVAGESAMGSATAVKGSPLDLDNLDLGFGADRASFGDQAPLDGQWQDAATKLDLAKAYQEMGDLEGAREILQEVLHEGDDQQKKDAQALLAKLTS